MASKSSAVHSIRVPNDVWTWITEEAKRRGVTPNSLVVDLLMVGQLRAEEAKANAQTKPSVKPMKPAPKAQAERSAFKSRLKGEWKAP